MEKWLTTWAQAHADMSLLCGKYQNHTVKTTVISHLNGNQIRLRLSNTEGRKPISVIQIGIQAGNTAPVPVPVNGKNEIDLLPKQTLYSDPVLTQIEEGMDITVTMAFRGSATSGNQLPETIFYSKSGNYALNRRMPCAKRKLRDTLHNIMPVIPILSGIEVFTNQPKNIIACFGDSITQQSHWTRPLGQMLQNAVIINKGIGGNQLLSDPAYKFSSMWGTAAMNRFQRDVLEETGVTDVIFALGTNDIGMARNERALAACSAEKLMAGLISLNAIAKAAGLRTYIATVTPRGNSTGYHDWHEKERQSLNSLIRKSDVFDHIIDFDFVTRDPKEPAILDAPCDSGDHLHPGPIGGYRMAKEAYRILGGIENQEEIHVS